MPHIVPQGDYFTHLPYFTLSKRQDRVCGEGLRSSCQRDETMEIVF